LPVECLDVEEDRLILPLPGLCVLLLVVDREAERRHLAAGSAKRPHLGVARQATDQHHLVQIGHGAISCAEDRASAGNADPSRVRQSPYYTFVSVTNASLVDFPQPFTSRGA